MNDATYAMTRERALLRVTGPDARAFLQGLVSNDVARATPERAIHAALLTPQGKFLHEFFIAGLGDALVLECEAARRDDLKRRLSVYRLRSKVTIEPLDGLAVLLLYGAAAPERLGLPAEPGAARPLDSGLAFVDPRLAALGARAWLPEGAAPALLAGLGFAPGDLEGYEQLRLAEGVPDGSRDLPVEKAILLENGFDELNGVDWQKGCYMGQELTARTKYRALIRKRLLPVEIDGPAPAPGTPVLQGEREAGEMRSAAGRRGLALLRLDALDGPLAAGQARLAVRRPSWIRLPEAS
ncbi:MAG: folate-binding protein [Dongiaceae bacterium]